MKKVDFAKNISKIADEHSIGEHKSEDGWHHYKGETLHGVAAKLLAEVGSDPDLVEHHVDMEGRHRKARMSRISKILAATS